MKREGEIWGKQANSANHFSLIRSIMVSIACNAVKGTQKTHQAWNPWRNSFRVYQPQLTL